MPRNAKPKRPSDRTRKEERLPPIFGRGAADRILICLAVNGPIRLATLASAVNRAPSSVSELLKRLVMANLVTTIPGKPYPTFALNPDLSVYTSLKALLVALHETWPARVTGRAAPALRPTLAVSTRPALQHVDARSHRVAMLALIAAAGEIDYRMIAVTMKVSLAMTLQTINLLESHGLVRSTYRKRHRLVSLDSTFPAAAELQRFLLDIASREESSG